MLHIVKMLTWKKAWDLRMFYKFLEISFAPHG